MRRASILTMAVLVAASIAGCSRGQKLAEGEGRLISSGQAYVTRPGKVPTKVGSSYVLRPGDKVEIRQASRAINAINASLAQVEKRPMMSWVELDKANFAGTFKGVPVRDELNEPPMREQLVVEYYSR